MSFTYDLATTVGQVRLTIGDTNPAKPFFQDEELQALLVMNNNNVGFASVQALRTQAHAYATKPKEQIGDYTVDYSITAKTLQAAADNLAASLGDESDDVAIGEAGGYGELLF